MKVLFIDPTHPYLPEELSRLGFICDHFPDHTLEDYQSIISQYSGIIVRSKIHIGRELISLAPQLQFIARVGAGMEGIDTAYAAERGIVCLNAPEGNRDALAEHTVGMLLALFNHFLRADQQVRKGVWDREGNRGLELMGKTVGIIGYGNMGSAFARRLQGFQAEVIAYDKYKVGYGDACVKETTMDELHRKCDIVSLHVPLTDETVYLVDDSFIHSFHKNIFLINTSRGKVVKTEDLLKHLQTGKVLGAALDVLEWEDATFENLQDHRHRSLFNELMQCERVILTPHVAGFSLESNYKLAKVIVDKIKDRFGL